MGIVRDSNGRPVGYVPGSASIRERMLLVALLEFAPDIRPAKSTLAIMLGISEREVRRLISSAKAKGLLRIEERPGQPNRYHLAPPTRDGSVPPTAATASSTRDRSDPPTRDTPDPPPMTNPTPEADKKQTIQTDKDCASQDSAPPLVLEVQLSKTPKTRKSKGKPKPQEPPDPRVTLLKEHYVAEHERIKRAPVLLGDDQWGRAMKAFKSLLKAAKDLDRAKRIVTQAFVTTAWKLKDRTEPWEITKIANGLNAELPAPVDVQRARDTQRQAEEAMRHGLKKRRELMAATGCSGVDVPRQGPGVLEGLVGAVGRSLE